MKETSYSISEQLFLVRQPVGQTPETPPVVVEQPTNNIVVIDCSGSMSWDLPKIREQLKRKLPKLLKESDTISIVWFSGRGQTGVLLEGEPVATLTDLQGVEQAIDRWLKPVGLTGFKEPLESVSGLVERVSKKHQGVFSLFFMSDGCDNQWSRQDILKAVEQAGQKVSSATFVEYGYYADRPLLTQMAEKCGGTLIFAEDFDRYAPSFEAVMQKKVTGAPRIEVKVKGDPIGGFCYSLVDGDLVTFGVEGGAVKVPQDLKEIWYLSPEDLGNTGGGIQGAASDQAGDGRSANSAQAALPALYGALSLYAQRMKSDVVYAMLRSVGDVRFIEQFSGCFGKQRYSEFMEAAKKAAFDPKEQFTKGFDPNRVPKDDAFTVLDLLRVLSSDEENRILLDSKDFRYSKIGRGRIDSSDVLTPEEQAEIEKLTEEMTQTKDAKKIKDLTAKIAAVTANKPAALKFEADKNEEGYSISSLTYNEERPNISFLVRKTGRVDLKDRLAKGTVDLSKVPADFETFIYRNYTVVKDGLVNLERLPVRLSAGTIRELKDQGMPLEAITGVDGETPEQARVRASKASDGRLVNVLFDLKTLPIINRKMIKEVSAKTLFELEYELCKARSAQKVYNSVRKEHFPTKESKGFVEQYGKEAADWLKEQGFTDYSGFSPKSVQAEATDFYMGKELKVSLKGLSSVPSLKDARDKIAKGKATPSVSLMVPYVKETDEFIQNHIVDGKPDLKALGEFLEQKSKEATLRVRGLLFQMAQLKFSIIVGQIWPSEFKSLDENSLTIEVDGQKIEGTLKQAEVEIKI